MQTYIDKIQEVAIEALEENKSAIKKALTGSLLEIIKKAPQYLEKILDNLGAEDEEE